ncbi:uncharacterized protein SiaT [Panulirus ornatus]|uniref:uncharacterized protein SiaT n=1 Tax=Panulirus ornatus TaxID=150431 RepID=UPI003A842407
MRLMGLSVWIFLNLVFLGMGAYLYLLWVQYWRYAQNNRFLPHSSNNHTRNNRLNSHHHNIQEIEVRPGKPRFHSRFLDGPPPPPPAVAAAAGGEGPTQTPNVTTTSTTTMTTQQLRKAIEKHKMALTVHLRTAQMDGGNILFKHENKYGVKYRGAKFRGHPSREQLLCSFRGASVRTLRDGDQPFTSEGVAKHFPSTALLEGRYFNTCAIISSAGALRGSKLGNFIGQLIINLIFLNIIIEAKVRVHMLPQARPSLLEIKKNYEEIKSPCWNYVKQRLMWLVIMLELCEATVNMAGHMQEATVNVAGHHAGTVRSNGYCGQSSCRNYVKPVTVAGHHARTIGTQLTSALCLQWYTVNQCPLPSVCYTVNQCPLPPVVHRKYPLYPVVQGSLVSSTSSGTQLTSVLCVQGYTVIKCPLYPVVHSKYPLPPVWYTVSKCHLRPVVHSQLVPSASSGTHLSNVLYIQCGKQLTNVLSIQWYTVNQCPLPPVWYTAPDFDLFPVYFRRRLMLPQEDLHLLHPASLWQVWDVLQHHTHTHVLPNPPSSGFLGIVLMLAHCHTVDAVEFVPSLRLTKQCHYWDVAANSGCTFGDWHPLATEKLLSLVLNQASDEDTFSKGFIRIPGFKSLACHHKDSYR